MKHRLDQFRRRAARYLYREPAGICVKGGVLSLSFDDFPKSAWEVAGPVLADFGIKATYYVAGGLCDGTNIGKVQFSERDLQEVLQAGHDIGCHTFSHASTLGLSRAELALEIQKNAEWVAERLDGYRMRHFAYPFGDASVGAKRYLGQQFLTSRGVTDGHNASGADRNNLKAIGLESRRLPHYDLEAIMAETASANGWLMAYGHDVERYPTPYGCTEQDLVRVIQTARQAGLAILPVSSAWSMICSSVD